MDGVSGKLKDAASEWERAPNAERGASCWIRIEVVNDGAGDADGVAGAMIHRFG